MESLKLDSRLVMFICTFALGATVSTQASAPGRYIRATDCVYKGRVGAKNIVECGETKFQVSQRGHDEYNRFSISRQTEISGVNVGSFVFKSDDPSHTIQLLKGV